MEKPLSKIKLFLDGADGAAMREFAEDPSVAGFTTNPSLMKQSGVQDYRAFSLGILKDIPTKPISFEVFADEPSEMKRQAQEIATWGKNVYVKIPFQNTQGIPCTELIRSLSLAGVQLNITAILTLEQVVQTCEALKGGAPSIVSVFAGRIADTGRDPIPVMHASRAICASYGKQIELLWASTRELYCLVQAEEVGCHIITVPKDILKKRSMLGKKLEDVALETVATFKKDADAAGFRL